jgi:triosephosphate isomerase
MRRKIAAGNWKMNLDYSEAEDLVKKLVEDASLPSDIDIIMAAPYVYLQSLNKILGSKENFQLAAQNMHEEESGAYTGEVSAAMLKSVDIDCVIIGHSERRQYFEESDELLKSKVDKALAHGMKVIFCCGEPLEIREANGQNGYVGQQLVHSLFHLDADAFSSIIIAYEPIWAIGTGHTASPEQAQEMHSYIRQLLTEKYGDATAERCSILYGGSVKPANAKEIFSQKDVDGGLVGGASLKHDSFSEIVKSFG